MLQAMNTGHDGSLSTCHANTPRDAVARIESMVLMAGIDFPMRAVRQQISRALDLIVQIERFSDGARKITSITEVQRMEGDTVTLQDIFEYKFDKDRADGGGQLVYTGLRPTCDKFERNGVRAARLTWTSTASATSASRHAGQPVPLAERAGAAAASASRPGRAERRSSGDEHRAHQWRRSSISVGCRIAARRGHVAAARREARRSPTRVSAYVTLRRDDPAGSSKSLIERALGDKQARKIARSPFITRLRIEMEVADIKFGLEQLRCSRCLLRPCSSAGCWRPRRTARSRALLALFVPVVAQIVIKTLADRQRRAFLRAAPDNLQVIASAMRVGPDVHRRAEAVLEDAPEPSKRELRRAVTDEQLGIPLPEALGQVTERMKSEDFQHVAIVASLQRETGGNTAEVIDLVAETVRERIEIRRHGSRPHGSGPAVRRRPRRCCPLAC